MTDSEDLRIAAQLQNEAIATADDALRSANLPTVTETILALDALASATEDQEIADARNAAIDIVMRATGTREAMPAFWMQRFGRVHRTARSPKEVAAEISPICEMEDVTPIHSRIRVPADKLEAVRKAVELVRSPIHYIEYLPLETDK
jgi:hypothetical protein